MATTIKLKNSVTTTAAPSTLVQGEVATNITDKKVWVGDASSTPVQILGAGATVAGTTGTFTGNVSVAGTFAANGGATLGDASGDALTINSSAVSIPNGLNFDSNTFVIDATNNRVGVGTASPTARFHVANAGVSAQATFVGTTGSPYITVVGDSGTTILGNESNGGWVGTTGSQAFVLKTADTERMRITSAGNVGIGTSSPSVKLDVLNTAASTTNIRVQNASASSGAYAQFRLDSDAATAYFGVSGSGNTVNGGLYDGDFAYLGTENTAGGLNIGAGSGQAIKFYTGGSAAANVRATLDSSGNLGLGVTPSAWSGYTAIQFNNASFAASSTQPSMIANAYYNGTNWIYQSTSVASRYDQINSTHRWFTAGSGTAGNAITFTQAMTLDASGNLGIGTTTPSQKLDVRGSIYAERTTNPTNSLVLQLTNQTTTSNNGCRLSFDAYNIGSSALGVPTDSASLAFYTGGVTTERMRIDSSGNLLVGTTSVLGGSAAKLQVLGSTNGAVFQNTVSSAECVATWNSATSSNNIFNAFYTETSPTSRGSITYNRAGGLTAYNTTSDYRAKDIISPVLNSGEVIDSVPVYMGKMKGATQARPMFIAHETPDYAHTGEKDAVDENGNPIYQQMDASALVPVLWAEIQSLRKRVALLESK
jgi:hypothetical protein